MNDYAQKLLQDLAYYFYEQTGEPDAPKVFDDEKAQNLLQHYMENAAEKLTDEYSF